MNNIKKRIDGLGRIVIPKQVRDELKIRDFDELNIFVENDSIILKKSITIARYREKLDRLLDMFKKIYDFNIMIIEDLSIIACNDSQYIFGDELIDYTANQNIKNEYLEFKVMGKNNIYAFVCSVNLIIDSHVIGEMIVFSKESLNPYYEDINDIKKLILDFI